MALLAIQWRVGEGDKYSTHSNTGLSEQSSGELLPVILGCCVTGWVFHSMNTASPRKMSMVKQTFLVCFFLLKVNIKDGVVYEEERFISSWL